MKKLVSLLLALALVLSLLCVAEAPASVIATTDCTYIAKYGNVYVDYKCADFLNMGYEFGDVVTVSFLNSSMDIPFCSNYSDVDVGCAALFARDDDEYLCVAINMGDFATTNGIAVKTTYEDKSYTWSYAEGVEGPVTFTISMKEAGAYRDQYELHRLVRTNERADYPDQTDAVFANFRAVSTTGMAENRLYRSSSPIDPEIGRSAYADAAMREAGVTHVLNLSETVETAQAFEGFKDTYYATAQIVGLNMGVDSAAQDFKDKLAEGLRFMGNNPGVYLVHCLEGKDRSGFVCAILECLMGASLSEVRADYMASYVNYYGFHEDEERYSIVMNSTINMILANAFHTNDLQNADLAACAEAYLTEIGLSAEEIAAVKANLAA